MIPIHYFISAIIIAILATYIAMRSVYTKKIKNNSREIYLMLGNYPPKEKQPIELNTEVVLDEQN